MDVYVLHYFFTSFIPEGKKIVELVYEVASAYAQLTLILELVEQVVTTHRRSYN